MSYLSASSTRARVPFLLSSNLEGTVTSKSTVMQTAGESPSSFEIGPYPWRISPRMDLANAGLDPGDEEMVLRARIFASLLSFVQESPLCLSVIEHRKEFYHHQNGFWIHIPFITRPFDSHLGVWGVPKLSAPGDEGARPHALFFAFNLWTAST